MSQYQPDQPEPSTDEKLLEELQRVGSDLGFRIRTRRFFWILIGLFIFDLVVSVLAIIALVTVLNLTESSCESDNDFRKAYVDQWAPIIADNPLPDPPPDDAPPEVKEAYERQKASTERFIEGLATDFAPKDC